METINVPTLAKIAKHVTTSVARKVSNERKQQLHPPRLLNASLDQDQRMQVSHTTGHGMNLCSASGRNPNANCQVEAATTALRSGII